MTVPLAEPQAAAEDAATPDGRTSGPPRRPRWRRVVGLIAWGLALGVLLSVPWWGRPTLQRLDFFHVRAVEVVGARYLDPVEVVRRLAVDTLHSVWDELAPLEARVAAHPQVEAVSIERKLPGTLVVRVRERLPVAFVASADGLRALDAAGRRLPIDPARTAVDLPVVGSADTTLLALLGELREEDPALYRRISEVRRVGGDELLFRLYDRTVRTGVDVTPARLAMIRPVEADLRRRHLDATELDLRFRHQVIARLP
ncbi:MAG TPA: FtsQ-type POTRA domain-containing protein [Gemmatimonadaceae bacterium]|nr:FtsQ-type POTRA domain-containing protein [Gemmatimonadaceae bacterium]